MNNRDFPTRLMFNNIDAPHADRWKDLEVRHGEITVEDPEQAWRFRLFNLTGHLAKLEALWTVHVVGHVGPLLLCASQEEDEFPWEGHDNEEAETIINFRGRMRFVVKEIEDRPGGLRRPPRRRRHPRPARRDQSQGLRRR